MIQVLFDERVSQNLVIDTGFMCPKCNCKFATAELAAKHLRNEHVDGAQTETARHEPSHMY